MTTSKPISSVINLLDDSKNAIYNMRLEEAIARIAHGDSQEVSAIDGQFALVAQNGVTVRMARTIGRLMRYFIAKREGGPVLIVSDRIDAIHRCLKGMRLEGQFHPSYTRMVPAHYLLEVRLVGCPDPNPTYRRFFTPERGTLPPDVDSIGAKYIGMVYDQIVKWLRCLPDDAPVGVCFSGGIDSGAIFLLAYHAMLTSGANPARLKAFTLAVDGGGADLEQARAFLRALDLELFLEPIKVPAGDVDVCQAIRVIEDYKPLDVQAAAVNLALLRGIRSRYPDWKFLLDGDGGDENLKDYPIEENPELTIRSVLNNPLLYQEGWGVDSIKHSLTYSGGQSRGYARCYAPAQETRFVTLSPYTVPSVIAVAEAIPFIAMTDWDHDCLYQLKGEIVSQGVRALTGMGMPVFPKRRFQRGATREDSFSRLFPSDAQVFRRMFYANYE